MLSQSLVKLFGSFFFLISTDTESYGNYKRGESAEGLGKDIESGLKPYLPNALIHHYVEDAHKAMLPTPCTFLNDPFLLQSFHK